MVVSLPQDSLCCPFMAKATLKKKKNKARGIISQTLLESNSNQSSMVLTQKTDM